MKAKVKVAFDGCIDGNPVPRKIEVGEEIQGDLARVAVEQKWAVEIVDKPAKEKPADEEGKDGKK